MIASLHGILTVRSSESLTIDIGGVGYKVLVSLQSYMKLPPLGEKVFLHIHTAVREDDITLFGFVTEEEKKIFKKLLSVNGIGPKLALTILSGIQPSQLVQAIHKEDIATLTSIQGIGKKTAERMILDLKDKLVAILGGESAHGIIRLEGNKKLMDDAISGLVNLGYARSIAERTLAEFPVPDGVAVESLIRQALKRLSEIRS